MRVSEKREIEEISVAFTLCISFIWKAPTKNPSALTKGGREKKLQIRWIYVQAYNERYKYERFPVYIRAEHPEHHTTHHQQHLAHHHPPPAVPLSPSPPSGSQSIEMNPGRTTSRTTQRDTEGKKIARTCGKKIGKENFHFFQRVWDEMWILKQRARVSVYVRETLFPFLLRCDNVTELCYVCTGHTSTHTHIAKTKNTMEWLGCERNKGKKTVAPASGKKIVRVRRMC